jgi:hypothetical protein
MRYRYEIDESNCVRIWDNENPNQGGEPFFYQPKRLDSTPWEDRAEAQAWVDAFIEHLLAPAPEEGA